MTYKIEYVESVVREDIPKRSKAIQRKIKKAIEQKLALHPLEFEKPLRYSYKGARSLRVGDWRVIYIIGAPGAVCIVKIGHRKDVCWS